MNLNIDISNDKGYISTAGKPLKDVCKNLKFKRNYCKFTHNLKKGIAPIEIINQYDQSTFRIKSKESQKYIYFPRYLTAELAEFLGYLVGDGYINKKGVELSNEDPEIIRRFSILANMLFGIKPSQTRDTRTKAMWKLRVISDTLVKILESLFGLSPGKKGKYLKIPPKILRSDNDVLRAFLRAYFDCDGHVSKGTRQIEITSESHNMINHLNLVLMRFGILSTKSKKYVKENPYWRLSIRARYAEIYADKIGFIVKHKARRCKEYKSIGLRQGCGKQDMIPIANQLKNLRQAFGYSLGEIQNKVVSYGNYERLGWISRESLAKVFDYYSENKVGRVLDIINKINAGEEISYPRGIVNAITHRLKEHNLINESENGFKVTEQGNNLLAQIKKYDKIEALSFINLLIESDVSWLRVNKIEDYKNGCGYVYDLTVEDNHSFIADGMIVHNTTTAGKLARYFTKRGFKAALLGLDVHRPAAMDQLEQIAKQVNVPVFIKKGEKDPIKIYNEFKEEYKKFDLIIIDTAGRDALSADLIEEIEKVSKTTESDERLLVISADIGQAAQKQAEQFHKSCNITGVIATKMDGTAKAGGALSACAITDAPIKFIGVGETASDLELFNPPGFVSRLLGMGDIEALLDKAKEAISEEDAADMGKKFMSGKFNLIDLYEQMQAMRKMGPLNKVVDMIPGFSQLKLPKDALQVQEGKLEKWKYVMQSMTKEELEDPEIISSTRIDRIAAGSGCSAKDVRELIKQYRQSKKMVKMMKGSGDVNKMMKKMQGKIPKGR